MSGMPMRSEHGRCGSPTRTTGAPCKRPSVAPGMRCVLHGGPKQLAASISREWGLHQFEVWCLRHGWLPPDGRSLPPPHVLRSLGVHQVGSGDAAD